MFQLIVAVISIALVAALALASIFYGGEAFTRGQLKAQVATMINQAQQISGANTLYKTDNGGVNVDDITKLVTEVDGFAYLAAAPEGPSKITETSVWELGVSADGKDATYIRLAADSLDEVKVAVDEANVGEIETIDGSESFYFPL